MRTAAATPCSAALLRPLLRVLLLTPLVPLHVHHNNACTSVAMGLWQAALCSYDSMFSTWKVHVLTSVLLPPFAR